MVIGCGKCPLFLRLKNYRERERGKRRHYRYDLVFVSKKIRKGGHQASSQNYGKKKRRKTGEA